MKNDLFVVFGAAYLNARVNVAGKFCMENIIKNISNIDWTTREIYTNIYGEIIDPRNINQ